MPILRPLFGGKSYLGIDIGTTTIKVVELSRGAKGKVELKNYGILETYGYLERFNNALQTSSLKPMENEVAAYLKLVLNHAGVRARDAVVSLPSFTAFTTLIELPEMSPQEMQQAMAFQAKQYIPLPISAVHVDWFKVGERTDENGIAKQQIFLISVPNEHIERYKRIIANAGLNLLALEIEGVSLARILTAGLKEPAMIVDIGARSSNFSIAKEGFLKFTAQTDFAGASLTQAVSSGLNLPPRRAEDLKKQRGVLAAGREYELSTLILPYVDVIINEARRAKDNFEKTYNEKVERVILSGGSANLLGLAAYLEKQLGLPTVKADPFSKITYPPAIQPLVKDLGSEFSVALGLAVRQLWV
jgi:type IV pilus assembly protein PilM